MLQKKFDKIKMNSTPIDTQQSADQIKDNKYFEFVKLYKSAAETKLDQRETMNTKKVKKTNKNSQVELTTSKRERSPPNKKTKKKSIDTSDLSNEAVEHSPSKTTKSSRKNNFTPNNKGDHVDNGVKSIMKNKYNNIDSLLNVSNVNTHSIKPKKRNKSVSFMLEDTEEVVVKKSKSNNSSKDHENQEKKLKNKTKVANTKTHKEKNNHLSIETQNINEDIKLNNKENVTTETMIKNEVTGPTNDILSSGVKKKLRKAKKSQLETETHVEITEGIVTGELSSENKSKKSKKKKRKVKSIQDGNIDMEGEPANKTRKKDIKPEVIARGLENLNIGDNAHTLTNLLDEMTVVDSNAKKNDSQKQPVTYKGKTERAPQQDSNIEVKEKVKWSNRKWNKGTKRDGKPRLNTSVVVENLPIKIMCNYKTLLSEHFSEFGAIAGIGVAEAYPSEDLKPVFTSTIFFQDEEAVMKALQEDNMMLKGSRIRVRRPRPPTETTIVVRAYGLSDQALSSLFSGAGRVRAIKQLVKGKKSMPTAFVEFDGPQAVERALKLAENAKINGKNMYVSKFEVRKKGKSAANTSKNGTDNDSSTE